MYLESQNIVNINWDKLQTASQSAVSTLSNPAGQIPFISTPNNFEIPLTSSMDMGFTIGFMRESAGSHHEILIEQTYVFLSEYQSD
jgi:hypothetical protein